MNLTKLNKDALIKLVNDLNNRENDFAELKKSHDGLKLKYDILKTAREEDSQKIRNAEIAVSTFQNRENDILNQFEYQKTMMKKDLDDQNNTIMALFNMMDNTINLQVMYYNQFKSMFLTSLNVPEMNNEGGIE
ncbi:MAG: hypothetical protein ACNA7U_01220 [Candidatus Izemoplasmataceae bacterium]